MSVDNRTSELALKWARRLEGPDLTEAERAALQDWLLADPKHADALGEACYIFAAVDALSAEKRAEILALPEGYSSEEESSEGTPYAAPAKSQPHWRAYALAASLVFATVLGVLWFTAANQFWRPHTYRTGTSEIRTVELPDGSLAYLNAKTTVRWPGFSSERRMELISGQALFDAIHDPAHPFYVHAGGGLVRVLGTKFDLNQRRDTTVLTVLEGVVEVVNSGEPANGRWQRVVSANQRLAYDASGPIDDVRKVDASKAVRWRGFALEFERELLSAALEDLSRYTDRPILLNDDHLRAQRVVGTLQVRDIRQAMRDLETIAPVAIRQDGSAFVLYRRVSKPPADQ